MKWIWLMALMGIFSAMNAFAEAYADPEVSQKTALLLQQVYGLAETNQASALALLQEGYDAENAEAVIDYALGSIHFSDQNYDLALMYYERAVSKMPTFKRAIRDLGRVYLANGQAERTVEIYRELISQGHADARVLNVLGYAHLMNMDYVSASVAFQQVLLLEPTNDQALKGLGQSLLNMEKYEEAYFLFDQLTRTRPFKQQLWNVKARAALASEHEAEGAVALETARRLGTADQEMLMLLGDVYLGRELPELAMEIYEQVGAVTNLPSERAINAVRILIGLQRYEDAKTLLRQLRSQNEDAATLAKLDLLQGDLAYGQGLYGRAEEAYQTYLSTAPLDGRCMLSLGDALKQQGQLEGALIQYERAQRISGMQVEALIRQAGVAVDRNQYERAIELLEKAQTSESRPYVETYLRQLHRLTEYR